MTKFIKISDEWNDEQKENLMRELSVRDIDAIVVQDSEFEVYEYENGDIQKVTIEGQTELEEEEFIDGSLFAGEK